MSETIMLVQTGAERGNGSLISTSDRLNLHSSLMASRRPAIDAFATALALGECIDEILKGSKRARELVQQILTFSRKGETQLDTVDLLPPIKEAHRFLRSTIPANIKLQDDFPDQLPLVDADPTQICEALLNLCTNAWHAIGERNGQITIRARARFLRPGELPTDELSPGPHFVLEIMDDGPGMAGTDLRFLIHDVRPDFPVILMTGHLRYRETEEYRETGFADVLRKPLTVEILSQSVSEILTGNGAQN